VRWACLLRPALRLVCAALCLLMDSADADNATVAGLEGVKSRTVALLAGGEGDGPHRRRALADLDGHVDAILQQPESPVTWPAAEGEATVNQEIHRHLAGVQRLATAWAAPGSRHEGSPAVLKRALRGLDNAVSLVAPGTPRPGNWYYWVIAIPERLGVVGLLLEPALPEGLRRRLEEALTAQLREMTLTGANGAWEARNHAYLALLAGDAGRLDRAARRLFDTLRFSADSGLREDFSYLYHGHIPYAGVYGGFVETAAQFVHLLDGTPWAARPERRDLLGRYLLEHVAWLIAGGLWDPAVCGRVYDEPRSARGGLSAMLYLTQIASSPSAFSQTEGLRRSASALIADGAPIDPAVAAFADRLAAPDDDRRGFRYWYASELGVYRSDAFRVSLRQFSERVMDYEYLNRQGPDGWNLAYGFTHVSRSGDEWFDGSRGERPVRHMDWQRLPGTTTRLDAHPRNDAGAPLVQGYSLNFGRAPLAGGAAAGSRGIAAFELLPTHGDFVARKSVSFFDEGFVALGSGITSTAAADEARPVLTTLLQWVTPAETTDFVVDGRAVELGESPVELSAPGWCAVDGVGLVPLQPMTLQARRIGRVVTVWLDHGPAPRGASYAYVLLPAMSADGVQSWAAAPPVTVAAHDETTHVVGRTDSAAGENWQTAAFFEAGTAAGIRVDGPTLLTWSGDGASGAVGVQEPLHTQGRRNVELPLTPTAEVSADDAVSARVEERLHLAVQHERGRIYRAAWGPASSAPHPSPRVELPDLYAFRAGVDADPQRAIFTVDLGASAASSQYTLELHGPRGHRLHTFRDADIVDRPGPTVVRYAWRHGQETPGIGAEDEDGRTQREGDFRLVLETPMTTATQYVSIPHFDAQGRPRPSTLPRDANRRPD
jgi:hyaluronate lyase